MAGRGAAATADIVNPLDDTDNSLTAVTVSVVATKQPNYLAHFMGMGSAFLLVNCAQIALRGIDVAVMGSLGENEQKAAALYGAVTGFLIYGLLALTSGMSAPVAQVFAKIKNIEGGEQTTASRLEMTRLCEAMLRKKRYAESRTTLACVLTSAALPFVGPFLKAIGQPETAATLAGDYALYSIPLLWMSALDRVSMNYLIATRNVSVIMGASLFIISSRIGLSLFLTTPERLAGKGPVVAQTIVTAVWLLFMLYYLNRREPYLRELNPTSLTARGESAEAAEFWSYAIPLAVSVLFEVISASMTTFMAGWLPEEALRYDQIAQVIFGIMIALMLTFSITSLIVGTQVRTNIEDNCAEKKQFSDVMRWARNGLLSVWIPVSIVLLALSSQVAGLFLSSQRDALPKNPVFFMMVMIVGSLAGVFAKAIKMQGLRAMRMPALPSLVNASTITAGLGLSALLGFVFDAGYTGLLAGKLVASWVAVAMLERKFCQRLDEMTKGQELSAEQLGALSCVGRLWRDKTVRRTPLSSPAAESVEMTANSGRS